MPRHRVGQRGLEVDDAAAHLVDHRQRGGAQLVRAPQLLHGRAQARAGGLRRARQVLAALVQRAQLAEHAGQLLERGPPTRLGGVRGQHQPHLGLLQQLAQLVRRGALARPGARSRRPPTPAAGRAAVADSRAWSRRMRSLSSARLASWNQRVSERTSSSAPWPRPGRPRGRQGRRRRRRRRPARPWPAPPRGRAAPAPRRRRPRGRRRAAVRPASAWSSSKVRGITALKRERTPGRAGRRRRESPRHRCRVHGSLSQDAGAS